MVRSSVRTVKVLVSPSLGLGSMEALVAALGLGGAGVKKGARFGVGISPVFTHAFVDVEAGVPYHHLAASLSLPCCV